MIKSPALWGVGLACALGGAVAGNAVGSTPILERSAIAAFYQTHDAAVDEASSGDALPDHYPLVTREGTVPVAALSDRGLYSQRRYRAVTLAANYEPADAEALSAYEPTPARSMSGEESRTMGDPRPAGTPDTSSERPVPLALAAPATVRAAGQAKTIDVALALAQD